MNLNKLIQTENTKRFIKHIKNLKETGTIKSYAEIIGKLGWNKTSLSNVMHKRENISDYWFSEFSKVYGMIEDTEGFSVKNLLLIDSKCDVILSTLAELLANLRGQTVEKIKTDLVALVNLRLKEKRELL